MFSQTTYQWKDQDTYNITMAALKSRSSTAESDLIFVRKSAPAQDAVIPMKLNGNVLTSIKNGKYELVNGVDYELNGEVLTLKASYVAKLTQSAVPAR